MFKIIGYKKWKLLKEFIVKTYQTFELLEEMAFKQHKHYSNLPINKGKDIPETLQIDLFSIRQIKKDLFKTLTFVEYEDMKKSDNENGNVNEEKK